ncbi:MAG: hypothetical protein HY060_18880, partial [Proteobacteria bacterium]|nr:hypothetical protein [Pseudomonadota bacterium]
LATLEAAGYAERHQGSATFVIGKAARTLALGFMAQFPVRDLALPYLQRLTLETGQASSLFVRLGWFAVRVATISGPTVLTDRTPIGEARSLLVGAPSRSILAFLPDPEFDSAVARAAPETLSVRTLGADRNRIRAAGIAVAASQLEPGAVDIAAPLFDNRDRAIASIAVEGAAANLGPTIAAAGGMARQIIDDLAAKTRSEITLAMSHYGHVDPDQIALAASADALRSG